MKPALTIPVSIILIGAVCALFMQGNRASAQEAQERDSGGIAAAGS
jgi:hypothetical protein